MSQSRNVLYQLKKQSINNSKSSMVDKVDEIDKNQQLKELQVKNRQQQSQIIRLKYQNDDLKQKIIFYQSQLKLSIQKSGQNTNNQIKKQIGSIPLIMQNQQLKNQIQQVHTINLQLNQKKNQLQTQIKQIHSILQKQKTKIKQSQILQNINKEKYKTQLENTKPIIIHDNKQLDVLKQGIKKVINFMNDQIVTVSYEIFKKSSDQCSGQRKTNSYNIFIDYWRQLQQHKHLGYLALCQSLKSIRQLQSFLQYDQEEIYDINNQKYRDTLNEWIIQTLTEINQMPKNQHKNKEQKLFRLLGLFYRSKFPIKGQQFTMDQDVKQYLYSTLTKEILVVLRQ